MRIGLVSCQILPEPDVDETCTLQAFREAGHDCETVPWDARLTCGAFDLMIIRSSWNYYVDPVGFLAWLEAIPCPVLNDLRLVRWNLHKKYLAEIDVPVVPTLFVEQGKCVEASSFDNWAGQKIVVKPSISAGSWKTKVFGADAHAAALEFVNAELNDRDMMIQPYLQSVETEGEHSLIYIDGSLSHVIRKNPRFDDQDESISGPVNVSDEFLRLGAQVMPYAEGSLYARVDVMRDGSGELVLSELELIEPSLFFTVVPDALPRFVAAATK